MLNLAEINKEMETVNGWSIEGNTLVKVFTFSNFKESLDFFNKVGEIAEKNYHHPDAMISYNVVRLSLSTHSENGLTKKDFEVARDIDKL